MEIEEKSISSAKWQNYTNNFYRLLLTARKEIKRCKEEAETSNKRATGRLLVSCPSCSQTFSSGEHRFMPSYIKVLRGSNRLELQFTDSVHLENWLLASALDTDASGLEIIPKENLSVTLSDVDSKLRQFSDKQKQNRSVEKTKTLFATDNREKHFSDEQNERVHDKDLCKPRSDEKKSNLLHSKKRDVVSNGHHCSRHSKTPRSSRNSHSEANFEKKAAHSHSHSHHHHHHSSSRRSTSRSKKQENRRF